MVDTIKFSQFTNSGDLQNDNVTVGYGSGLNQRYNNPWTFLAPGTTGDRPIPSASMYYRLRFNTTLEIYEYYDPTIPIWVELSGSGTGTVNPGVANDLAFYAASGQAISPISGSVNSVLITSSLGVPSLNTTLPTGLNIPSAIIIASTAALLSGSVVAAPVVGSDLVNKTYADGLFGAGVTSLTGTTNQISFSSSTGNVTASLPQDIALGSTPTFAGMTLSAIPLGSSSGGTGINNGSRTLTLSGNLSTVGAFSSTFTMTGITSVTFPVSGTLATTSQIPTGEALTKTDDTNVTLTLGGNPSTALVNAASLTLGWTGQLAVSRGGTGVSTITTAPTASEWAGWDANSNLSANLFISGFATTVSAGATTTLTVASKQIQELTGTLTQTYQMPVASTIVAGMKWMIINNSSNVATVNSSGGNLILTMAANTTSWITCVSNSGTTASSWNASYLYDAGSGVLSITGTSNQVNASSSTGNITLSLPQSIASTSSPAFTNLTLTGASILDVNGNKNLSFGYVASAVNYLQMVNSSTTNVPSIQSMGSDANVSIALLSKGDSGIAVKTAAVSTTPFQIYNGTTSQHLTNFLFANTANTRNVTFPDKSGTVLLTTSVIAPTIQKFLSGSGTYTTPTSTAPLYIRVIMVGGGAGGSASGASPGAAVNGGNTTFGTTLLVANGGSASTSAAGGLGGSASLGSGPIGISISGAQGNASTQLVSSTGGSGGSSYFGGAGEGAPGNTNPGIGAATNTGSGGGGASGTASSASAAGGGAGGFIDAIISSPSATYSYAVGAGGSGATLGTGGSAGGNGAAGAIYVYEYYQ